MLKQLATTLMLTLMFVLVLDPASAHAASPSFQLLRAADGRQLEAESASSSTNATNPLYESNTKIKGCKTIQYFFFWSCCGWNSC
ncbi:hypothetical protein V7S43_008006 [Phytophthora oleae]|uniref:RxLR effector protein n=1 Tax=Phytophthora oleae TaxID=2107226 RepID=A0ABD3FL36_9STRA